MIGLFVILNTPSLAFLKLVSGNCMLVLFASCFLPRLIFVVV